MAHGDGQRLRHGYTNHTVAHEGVVTKTYHHGDKAERLRRELLALRELGHALPVAHVCGVGSDELRLGEVQGTHGQDLIDAGEGDAVMFALGQLLRDVQSVTPAFYPEYEGHGVLVHGDFGPNNVLLNESCEIVLLADWEWSTVGSELTDLVWAEFIVRMHHPAHLDCVEALFDGYGERPLWSDRKACMEARANAVESWARSYESEQSAGEWRRRVQLIAEWTELP